MTPLERFRNAVSVRRLMTDLATRHQLHMEGDKRWAETVTTLLPQVQRYCELLMADAVRLPSEADRKAFIESAWREFGKTSMAFGPASEWPSRQLGPIGADWTWIAFDKRRKGIRVDLGTGMPAIVSLPRAQLLAGLDIKMLSRKRAFRTRPSLANEMRHRVDRSLTITPALEAHPSTACQACHHAAWTSTQCFCEVMHRVTWSTDQPETIVTCDGLVD